MMNPTSASNSALSQKLEELLRQQTVDDGALDLFNPSVEAIIAPFYELVRPHCVPLSERDPLPDKFAEYFTRGRSVASWSKGDTPVIATAPGEETNLPL